MHDHDPTPFERRNKRPTFMNHFYGGGGGIDGGGDGGIDCFLLGVSGSKSESVTEVIVESGGGGINVHVLRYWA